MRPALALAGLALAAGCGSSVVPGPVAVSTPYRDLPELPVTTTVASTTTTTVVRLRAARSKARVESRAKARVESKARAARVGGDLSALLDRLAMCESTMNRYAHSGPHHSYFQWLPSTWRSVSGLPGHPEDYDYATQKAAAARIPVSAWPSQFPACSRRIL